MGSEMCIRDSCYIFSLFAKFIKKCYSITVSVTKKKLIKKLNLKMLTSGPGKFLAPTSLGAGYAVAKMLSLRAMDLELAIAQDFFYQFLAGVLLGFALRPVANMIYWKRSSAVIVFSTYLIALGPLGYTFRHISVSYTHLTLPTTPYV